MEYTAPEVLLFISALGAIMVNTVTAWRTSNKVGVIETKTAIIEGHVNSRETKLTEQAIARDREIEILKTVIDDLKRVSALSAQAYAQSLPSITLPTPPLVQQVITAPISSINKIPPDLPTSPVIAITPTVSIIPIVKEN